MSNCCVEEMWKDAKFVDHGILRDYSNYYQVSSFGRIRSIRKGKKRLLSPYVNRKGYLVIGFSKPGEIGIKLAVHRLVAYLFIPNPYNLPQVNHINEDKTDNRVDNLEWCDNKYNCNYGSRSTRSASRHTIPIVQLTIDGHYVRSWKSTYDIKRELGLNPSSINRCCKDNFGRRGFNIYKGYKWQYLDKYMILKEEYLED